jgi:hypothetical protein
LRNSRLILPRERSREPQWIANRSSAFYRRPPQRASRPTDQVSSHCHGVQSQRECHDGIPRGISQWIERL